MTLSTQSGGADRARAPQLTQWFDRPSDHTVSYRDNASAVRAGGTVEFLHSQYQIGANEMAANK
jgi:hypothetical protein